MPPFSVLIKPASGACNMRCDYCFYMDETAKREQSSYGLMTSNTLKNVIRKTLLNADTAIHYMFQGGEPTLAGLPFFEEVLKHQQHYNKNNVAIYNAIQTNGVLIDEDWCRFLHDHHFLVGLSIDGTKEIHNSLRHDKTGGETFSKVLHAAALMDRFEVDYNILTVVTPAVAKEAKAVYSYYKEKKWLYQQYIACLDPLNEGHRKTPYALTPDLYGQFLIDLFNLWYQDCLTKNAPYIRQFQNYVSMAAGHLAASCDQCGVCSVQYVVEANGNVYPCDFYMLDEYLLGNFNENSFAQTNEKREKIAFIQRSIKLPQYCRDCSYHWICKGGCQRNRDFVPELDAYENYFCESYRMFFDACLEKIKNLAAGAGRNMP